MNFMPQEIPTTKIALFKGKKIRKTIHHNEWWFVISDVIEALTDSIQPDGYIKDMRRRDPELAKGWGQIATPLSISTPGGLQKINCANTESIFRIVQSIPSPKAEPLKRWLAKVGYERVQEIEDPELATKRTRMLYKLKGYDDDWIEKRMRGIAIREQLTDEWQNKSSPIQKSEELDSRILFPNIQCLEVLFHRRRRDIDHFHCCDGVRCIRRRVGNDRNIVSDFQFSQLLACENGFFVSVHSDFFFQNFKIIFGDVHWAI
jgi:hypothetical protein